MKTGGGRRGRRKKLKVENVGRYVRKEFAGYGVFLGKVVSFADGLYRVDYEDGDFEDLETNEVEELMVDESGFDGDYRVRKVKLDELIRKKGGEGSIGEDEVMVDSKGLGKNDPPLVCGLPSNAVVPEVVVLEKMDIEAEDVAEPVADENVDEKMDMEVDDIEEPEEPVDGDVDSSSDSGELDQVRDLVSAIEVPLIPPLELPSSSGNIGVPEESVSHLFAVYSFLRSFSFQLYLSPFKLDDFVGSLNCPEPNTLLGDVHFTLLRALRLHLESISSDGAKHAAKCLRRLDWSLLDTLTWPIYLVEYLVTMDSLKGPEWKEFSTKVLTVEYYSLPVAKKLMILQILCDDVMEFSELRAEINSREDLVEQSGSNGTEKSAPPLNGPTRVHPKYSKTSAGKDLESNKHSKPSSSKSNHEPKIPELDTDTTDVDQDENNDECKLCGMDGTLLCCDGCPSAYHSRCIGLNKTLIPDGLWYCPECTTKKAEPAVNITSGLNGAEIFGVDPYEQIFMGIFDHLLVFNVSIGGGSSSRYYKKTDIPKVIQVLCSTEQHKSVYSEICKSIMQYWQIKESLVSSLPLDTKEDPKTSVSDSNFSLPGITEAEKHSATDTTRDSKVSVSICTLEEQRNAVEGENCLSSALDSIKNEMLLGSEIESQQVQPHAPSLETVNQENGPVLQRDDNTYAPKLPTPLDTQSCEKLQTESLVSSVSINHFPHHSYLTQHDYAERPTELGLGYPWGINGAIDKKLIDGVLLPKKDDTSLASFVKLEGKTDFDATNGEDKSYDSLYMGDLFKPQTYTNQYFQGDIAAAAAANLLVLASEGKVVTETHGSANYRKMVSANIALQLKAFSSVSVCFIWPNSEKKVMEVPRERCGWCFACKAPTTSKRGCLLNLAASNAIKGSARGLRPIKNGEGSIPRIAAYILYMADSLRGLLVGPFLSSSYRKQWRKDIEEASTCSALKFSLLKLEEHIRPVAFSGDWVKLVDDWMVESSAAQNTTLGAPPKRPGRRGRKPAAIVEVATDPGPAKSKIVSWWRGGKLSKLVFQRSLLPYSVIKKAARQGGRKRISGIYYTESSENPKRSRRFAWRVAVEMSRNAPQLALQVRYLDLYLRWGDMVRSDQNSHDGKGMEAETLAYRNARICDKRTETSIRYGLIFNQKHLPSRVMKNIVEVEKNENGEETFWFSETHVPLFLIKEYEQKMEKNIAPPSKISIILSKLQKKQLKAFRKNIFSYLMHKEEKVNKCPCASCQEDLLLGDAVKCNDCEGYCHKDCAPHSTISREDEGDYAVTCNKCLAKTLSQNESLYKTPGSQSFPQVREYKPVGVFSKESLMTNGNCQPLVSDGNSEPKPLIKSTISGRSLASRSKRGGRVLASYGVIWKQKNSKQSGTDFQISNILLRCNGDINPSHMPDCYLCSKPYNPNLMYICCEECKLWYHADAVQLKESQIFDVVGFKCCKCRRKSSPICPYEDAERRRHPDGRRSRPRAAKQRNNVMETEHETISRQLLPSEMSTEWDEEMEEMLIRDDDPLLFSLERVEPISETVSDFSTAWDSAGASFPPQKLPIRRQPKLGNEALNQKLPTRGEFNGGVNAEISNYDGVNFDNMEFDPQTNFFGNASPPQAEWEFPVNGSKDDELFDYENMNFEEMEFEPQTYFSYTELLDTDDNQSSLCDPSTNAPGDLVNPASCVAPSSNLAEPQNADATNVAPTVKAAPCRMCSRTEPAPELICEVCEMQMHNACSIWEEYTASGGWKCGNCRDWV